MARNRLAVEEPQEEEAHPEAADHRAAADRLEETDHLEDHLGLTEVPS